MSDATTTVHDETKTADSTTQTSTEVPYYKDWYNPIDGAINHKSLERLPDHLKGVAPLLQNTKTIDDVLMRYQQANTLASKKALAPLVGNEPKEVIAERKALIDAMNGVPKEAKDYGVTRPKEIEERFWNAKLVDGFQSWAHKHSVSPAAVKELVNDIQLPSLKEQLAAQAEGEKQFWAKEQQAFEAAIRTESIPAERASALVEKGATAFGLKMDDPQTKLFLQGSMARLMCMRYAIATGEDTTMTSDGGGKEGGDAKAQADDIRSNPSNPLNGPYWNEGGKYSRSAHDTAVERHTELMRLHHAKTPVIDRRRRT